MLDEEDLNRADVIIIDSDKCCVRYFVIFFSILVLLSENVLLSLCPVIAHHVALYFAINMQNKK